MACTHGLLLQFCVSACMSSYVEEQNIDLFVLAGQPAASSVGWVASQQMLAGAPFVQWLVNAMRPAVWSLLSYSAQPYIQWSVQDYLSSPCAEILEHCRAGQTALPPQQQLAGVRALSAALAMCMDLEVSYGAFSHSTC